MSEAEALSELIDYVYFKARRFLRKLRGRVAYERRYRNGGKR